MGLKPYIFFIPLNVNTQILLQKYMKATGFSVVLENYGGTLLFISIFFLKQETSLSAKSISGQEGTGGLSRGEKKEEE